MNNKVKDYSWIKDGAVANYHSVIGRDPTRFNMEVDGFPFDLNGQAVVKVKGISGVVSVEALSPVEKK